MLGRRLKKLRTEKGLTQTELGNKFNLSKETISHYEKERRRPPVDLLNDLADYFEVSLDYLVGNTDKRLGINKKSLPPIIEQLVKEFQIQDIEALSYAKEQGLNAEDIKAIVDVFEQLRPLLTKKDK